MVDMSWIYINPFLILMVKYHINISSSYYVGYQSEYYTLVTAGDEAGRNKYIKYIFS